MTRQLKEDNQLTEISRDMHVHSRLVHALKQADKGYISLIAPTVTVRKAEGQGYELEVGWECPIHVLTVQDVLAVLDAIEDGVI